MMLFPTQNFSENGQRSSFFARLFRKIFLDDWVMKLIALIITLALWLGISGFRKTITTPLKNIALQPRISNDFEITNSPITEVTLVVTGDNDKIKEIKNDNLIVSVDLTSVQGGERIIQLTPETVSVDLPTGVKLEEIQPNKIAVKLERVEEREVSVKAETEGRLPDGFEIYSETVVPSKVRVRAPESYLKSLDSILTEKINIHDKEEDFTAKQVSLNVVNPKATALDTVVDVIFKIGEKRIEKNFSVTIKTEKGTKTATVKLYGPHSIIENLRPEQISAELVKNEAGENSLQIILPSEIRDKIEIREKTLVGK